MQHGDEKAATIALAVVSVSIADPSIAAGTCFRERTQGTPAVCPEAKPADKITAARRGEPPTPPCATIESSLANTGSHGICGDHRCRGMPDNRTGRRPSRSRPETARHTAAAGDCTIAGKGKRYREIAAKPAARKVVTVVDDRVDPGDLDDEEASAMTNSVARRYVPLFDTVAPQRRPRPPIGQLGIDAGLADPPQRALRAPAIRASWSDTSGRYRAAPQRRQYSSAWRGGQLNIARQPCDPANSRPGNRRRCR